MAQYRPAAEIDLMGILNMIKRRLLWIVLSAAVCAVAVWGLSKYCIAARYTATVTMYVYSDASRVSLPASTASITSSELTASQTLVDTYIVILKSDTVLEKIRNALNLDCSVADLESKISAHSVNNTEVFSVSVEDTDPKLAQEIANKVAEIAPAEIVRVVKAGGVEIIDYAGFPAESSFPNVKQNVVIGLAIGTVLSFLLFLVIELFNTKIRCEEDISTNFEIAVLGYIPQLAETGPKAEKGA